MLHIYIYTAMGLITTIISAWAVVSLRVAVGIYTKAVLALLSLSSFANAGWVWVYSIQPTQTELMFMFSVMVLSIRCYCIKYVRPRVRKHMRERCE